MSNEKHKPVNERNLILIIGLIQFVNILDFMMVMPLGPDFARALDIPTSKIGMIGGSYTLSAAITGLVAAMFLDQFPRKKVILIFLAGLMLATFSGALAWSMDSMLFARVLAGMFGGPVTALSMAFIADYIPAEQRGRAMGKVAGAFAAASVLGVPFGLELASRISWHAPFIVTGLLCGIVLLLAYKMLPYHKPYISGHKAHARLKNLLHMLSKPLPLTSYAFMFLTMTAGFMIVPNIAAHLQMNIGFPREKLGMLYFFGGIVSFFGMRVSGWITDKTSSTGAICIFTTTFILSLITGFVWFPSPIPVILIFICFMVSSSGRMVAAQTLCSKIPAPQERGSYMSIQSAITHFGSAAGAYYSSLILVEDGNKLLYVPIVGLTAIILSLIVPFLVFSVERRIKKRVVPVVVAEIVV